MPAVESTTSAAILTAASHGHGVLTEMGAVVVIATTTMTAYLLDISTNMELAALLLPLIGAMIVTLGMFMLNPEPETRLVIGGRCAFGLFFGSLSPSIIGYAFSWATPFLSHAAPLLAAGGIMSGVFYLLSVPITARAYANQKALGNAAVKLVAESLHVKIQEEVAAQVAAAPPPSIVNITHAP